MRFSRMLRELGHSFLDLFYPPLCLHCQESLSASSPLLCEECLLLMTPVDPAERCPCCFSEQFDPKSQHLCFRCQKKPFALERLAAVFDYDGPAAILVRQLKYANKKYLAQGLAAYLAYQLIQLEWPVPDIIIPMPISWLRLLDRGYNQALLLAQELSPLLSRPVQQVLVRRIGGYSQAGLNQQQRLQLSADAFELKMGAALHDKRILLIDDVMTTGQSLECCAQALAAGYPSHIYALTVCRALE